MNTSLNCSRLCSSNSSFNYNPPSSSSSSSSSIMLFMCSYFSKYSFINLSSFMAGSLLCTLSITFSRIPSLLCRYLYMLQIQRIIESSVLLLFLGLLPMLCCFSNSLLYFASNYCRFIMPMMSMYSLER